MPTSACDTTSIECSLSRIADSLTADWTWVGWVTSVVLPLAGIAASILIGIASLRLAGAANRLSREARATEAQRLGRQGRERFVSHLVDWLELRWSEYDSPEPKQASAESLLQASLRLRAAVLEPGVDPRSATAVVEAADLAWDAVSSMPAIEKRVSASSMKNAVLTLAHSYLALPDLLDDTLVEFAKRVDALKSAAASGSARSQLREVLKDTSRENGTPRSDAEIEALLDAFESHVATSS